MYLIDSSNLISQAKEVGLFMAREYTQKGDYFPEETWGGEGQIYPSLMGIGLLELYKITKDQIFLDGLIAIIKSNVQKQLPSGGWALALASTGDGLKFVASQELKDATAKIEDLPPTATALRLIAEYQLLTGDTSYQDALEKGFRFLMKYWNAEEIIFNEMLTGEALKLRANPKNYQIYAYQCICSLSNIFPEVQVLIEPLYRSIKNIFEAMDAETYPLLYSLYASLIVSTEGKSDYTISVVKNRIIKDITFESPFIIKSIPGAMGHKDGLRGVVLDEGHLRNSIGAALVLKFYDKYVEEDCFTSTEFYNNLSRWIQSMYNGKGRYFEFLDITTGEKRGLGTPGQFLPLWWILGCI